MKAEKAIKVFWEEYNKALNQQCIRKPVSYALYMTWVKVNSLENERICIQEDRRFAKLIDDANADLNE